MASALTPKSEEKKTKASESEQGVAEAEQPQHSAGAGAGLPRFMQGDAGSSGDDGGAGSQKSAVRARMERAFGTSFGGVRMRTDQAAAERAANLQARAYTDGKEIGFARGAFAPDTRSGMHTIAHEFAHVAQSRAGRPISSGSSAISTSHGAVRAQSTTIPQDDIEADADAAAEAVVSGNSPNVGYARIGSVATQKHGAANLPEAPPRGIYKVGLAGGDYYYIFDWEDVKSFGNQVALEVLRRHFRDEYPSAPTATEQACLADVGPKLYDPLTSMPAADGKQIVRFHILARTEKDIKDWMTQHAPSIPRSALEQGGHVIPAGQQAPTTGQQSTSQPAPQAPAEKKVPVNGTTVHLPDSIPEDQQKKALEILQQIMGTRDPNAPAVSPADKDLFLTTDAIKLLLDIDKSENKQAILDLLKNQGSGPHGSFDYNLERAIAQADVDKSRQELDMKKSSSTWGEEPIVNRPVHGHILNRGGYIVVGQEINFEFIVDDDVDAFRVPMISINWVAHLKGQPKDPDRQTEHTKYIPIDSPGLLNDKYFNISFDKEGTYTIEAFVSHNFFTHNHFTQDVRVLSQETLLSELQQTEALKDFATPPTKADPTLFDVGGLQGYQFGETGTGKLDPKFTTRTIEAQLKTEEDQEKTIKDYLKSYEGLETDEARAIRSWGKDYLETLEKSRGKLKEDKGATPLAVRGVYVSKTKEVPSKTLDLLCYFKKSGDSYDLTLYDFTHVYENEDYRFRGSGDKVADAEKDAFVSQSDAYPAGLLSVTFQVWDETAQKGTDQYVQYTMTTETMGKSIKSFVFGTAADLAINLLAVILMVIPGFAPLGLALAIGYNTAKTLSELRDSFNKGTLTNAQMAIGFGSIALNLIPLAGRGAKLFTIAGKAFHVVDAVVITGNVLLITVEGMQQVEKLRNGVIQDLSDLDKKIKDMQAVNMADPKLPALITQREDLIKKGKDATRDVFTKLYGQGLIMMVGQHLVSEYAARKLSIGELKNFGAFRNEPNSKPRLDYTTNQIVGDELTMSPADLDSLQRKAAHNGELQTAVPDPAQRQQIVEAIGDRDVEIHTGAPETKLEAAGDKPVLNVADNATPGDILTEAQKTAAVPAPKKTAAPPKEFKPVKGEPPVETVLEEPAPKEPPAAEPQTPEQVDAAAEAAAQLELEAKAAYKAAKAKGYGKGKGPGKALDEKGFVEKYKKGEVYDLDKNRWAVPESRPKKVTPPFPKGTTPDMAFEFLAGPKSPSSFKPYFEMLEKFRIATKQKVLDALKGMVGAKERSVDGVRHGLKEQFRPEAIDAMFTDDQGKPLDLKASQKKMIDMTSGLNSKDMGNLAEDWVQRARQQVAGEQAQAASQAAGKAQSLADAAQAKADAAQAKAAQAKDAADAATAKGDADAAEAAAVKARQDAATAQAEAAKAEAAKKAVNETPRQVEVKASEHPPMKGDRVLDRVEGDAIVEVKRGGDKFSDREIGELDDHLALVGKQGGTINVKGTPTPVRKVTWKSVNPAGAKANAPYMKQRLQTESVLSWEATNDKFETKVFTGANVDEIDGFLGISKKK
ncbi:MAG TPA: DUF4157 domain-containing protein [Bryobacteraceae bacterium]|nr:DUF4157 domain-containing protein [Bryobacteraceae bacterium]